MTRNIRRAGFPPQILNPLASSKTTSPSPTGLRWRIKGWEGQEAWTQEQQDQEQQQQHAGGDATEEVGYEGWVWDDTSGWYYDEELAARQAGGAGGLLKEATTESPAVVDTNSTSGGGDESGVGSGSDRDSDSDSDSSSGDEGAADTTGEEGAAERKKRRRKRRRPSLPPRNYPRSKAQRLVDEVEDSVEGARPEALDLSKLDMDRVTSRVYRLDWLRHLDLSSNRLYRISPDLASLESLVDINLRHNRYQGWGDRKGVDGCRSDFFFKVGQITRV